VPKDVQAVSALKATMSTVLRGLREHRRPVLVVSNGVPQAVLQDVASYEGIQDAIALLKMMLLSVRSVAAGRGSPHRAVITRLRQRVAARTEAAQA
jgi:prevent-host-death family protein